MMKRISLAVVLLAGLLSAGCVDIEQEILMNHDGSGKIVEKIALTPRGMRLFEGMKKRTGSDAAAPAIFSDEAFQARMKAMGEVTLVSKAEVELPDGRKQLNATYAFKDANKIKFWMIPSLSYMKLERGNSPDGSISVKYEPEFDNKWGKIYRESVTFMGHSTVFLPNPSVASPAERQKFLRVLPVIQDALKDFRLSIVLVAPIEEFEENDMKWGLPINKNRATILRMDGDSVIQASSMLQQLVMNEVSRDSVGAIQSPSSGIFTPGNGGVRFMKSTPAPAAAAPSTKK